MQPHPVLKQRYKSEIEKRSYLRDIFNATAHDYDRAVHWGSFGRGNEYRRRAMIRAGMKRGMQVLDVGCGTGLTTEAALKALEGSGSVVAIDPSEGMLKQARKRVPEATFRPGSAANTACDECQFDFLVMGYALRHVEDLDLAFEEYFRVLKPGGKLLLLELTKPENEPLKSFAMKVYLKFLLPSLTWVVSGFDFKAREMMHYYWETIEAVVPPGAIIEAMKRAGFKRVRRKLRYSICSEYVGIKPQ